MKCLSPGASRCQSPGSLPGRAVATEWVAPALQGPGREISDEVMPVRLLRNGRWHAGPRNGDGRVRPGSGPRRTAPKPAPSRSGPWCNRNSRPRPRAGYHHTSQIGTLAGHDFIFRPQGGEMAQRAALLEQDFPPRRIAGQRRLVHCRSNRADDEKRHAELQEGPREESHREWSEIGLAMNVRSSDRNLLSRLAQTCSLPTTTAACHREFTQPIRNLTPAGTPAFEEKLNASAVPSRAFPVIS